MYNFLSIGYDCSTASALRSLGLRTGALPFDWAQSSINSLKKCFETDFEYYHKNVFLTNNKRRVIDRYGFEFPHDYPTKVQECADEIYSEHIIVDDWLSHYNVIKEKYDRRIARFKEIINDPKPAIVLCRYKTAEVLRLQQLFIQYYNKSNLFFLNACPEIYNSDKIININPERNNEWNDGAIWKEGIQMIEKLVIDSLHKKEVNSPIIFSMNPAGKKKNKMSIVFSHLGL